MFTQTPLIFLGTLGMAALVVVAICACRLLWLVATSRRWEPLQAHLASVTVKYRTVHDRSLRGEALEHKVPLSLHVRYTFAYGGQQHSGWATNLAELALGGISMDRNEADRLKAAEGTAVTAWVDPTGSRAVLFRRVPLAAGAILLLAAGAAGTAVLVAWPEIVESYGGVGKSASIGVISGLLLFAVVEALSRALRPRVQ